jgi:hypothetical protein
MKTVTIENVDIRLLKEQIKEMLHIQEQFGKESISYQKLEGVINLLGNIADTAEEEKKCYKTGEMLRSGEGYRVKEVYFKYESDLIDYFRSLGDEQYNDVSDFYILDEAHSLGEFEALGDNFQQDYTEV